MMRRTTFREIKNTFGRFAAIRSQDDKAGYGEHDLPFS